MDIGFIDRLDTLKHDLFDVYHPLLPNLCSNYVENYYDGTIYAYKGKNVRFEDLMQYFLKAKFYFTTQSDKELNCCVCLLVNPYFNEFCNHIKSNIQNLDKRKIVFLKKQVFEKLSNETYRVIMCYDDVLGSEFFKEHNCYEESKEMLKIINLFLASS